MKWKSTLGFFHPEKASVVQTIIEQYVTSETNCVEIGVLCGKSLMHLVEHSNPNHVYAIDPFEGGTQQQLSLDNIMMVEVNYNEHYDFDKVTKKFQDYDNVTIIKGYSPLHDYDMPDIGYAFIDGNHTKEHVIADAEWVYSCMQEGVMIFDDYGIEGVEEAVKEFATKYNLDINLSETPTPQTTIAWILVKKG